MYNNVLLALAMSIIPVLAIGFVAILIIYKVYIKIRSRFNIAVNCWFCNHNTKVPYLDANSWLCPSCDQYNGFTKDGDYNREIYEQLDCSGASEKRFNISTTTQQLYGFSQKPLSNGFCDVCNEAQRLKVEKLAQFEPKNESRFNEELRVYQAQLENQYRLCSTCDRHLNKVLREKKKMVLGSKFLDFIIKGAESLKQPHLKQIEHAIQEKRKLRLRNLISLITVINVFCLLSVIPTIKKEHFTQVMGSSVGQYVFIATSHIFAVAKVLGSYLNSFTDHEFLVKLSLFSRTIFMMLMYSMGLKVSHFSLSTWFVSIYPFAVLSLAFYHNVVDGFRLTRYTSMVVLWSLFAGGLIDQQWSCSPQVLMLLTSVATLAMALATKPNPSPKLHDNTSNSFHKIYSEDYLSDDDTMSILSQQLNGSSVSMRSVKSNKSFTAPHPITQASLSSRLTKSPLTSSGFSLNQMPRTQLSLNSSFRSYAGEENQTVRPIFATPMPMPPVRQGLFSSNLELNTNTRPNFDLNSSMTNTNVFNNSFVEPRDQTRFLNQTQHNDASFFTAANSSTTLEKGDQTFLHPSHISSGIYSPFSASTSAVYHQTQNTTPARKLVSPTRFSTTNLANHTPSNASWLSGGYFNQRQSMSEIPRNGLLLQMAPNTLTPMEEGLSRASSHSSGFESQTGGRQNISRENSICQDFNDFSQRTLTMDNINSFQPIDQESFSPRPSVLSNPSMNNTTTAMFGNNSNIWKQSAFTRRPINSASSMFSHNTTDSFNLRKINEELPAVKRGAMFQQWKEGQTIS